jgi:hypothetical protein
MIYCWLAPRNTISSQHPRKATGRVPRRSECGPLEYGHEQEDVEALADLQLVEVAIQPTEDTEVVAANDGHLVAFRLRWWFRALARGADRKSSEEEKHL